MCLEDDEDDEEEPLGSMITPVTPSSLSEASAPSESPPKLVMNFILPEATGGGEEGDADLEEECLLNG